MLLLQKQHCAVTLTPLYVLKIQSRCKLFITAVHTLFTHCSVVSIQSVLVLMLFVHLACSVVAAIVYSCLCGL